MLIRFISIFRPLLLTSSSMEIIFIPKNVLKRGTMVIHIQGPKQKKSIFKIVWMQPNPSRIKTKVFTISRGLFTFGLLYYIVPFVELDDPWKNQDLMRLDNFQKSHKNAVQWVALKETFRKWISFSWGELKRASCSKLQ